MSEPFNSVEAAAQAGVDLSLIEESLGYSYEQRALHHQEALNLALELEEPVKSFVSDINRLLQRLCDAEIEFVIVGGFAAMLHGSSLLTRDLDVCAVLTRESVAKLREILRDLHPAHRLTSQKLSFLDNPDPDVDVLNLYLRTDFGPVDFLSFIAGVGDFATVRANAIEVELFGRRCRVMSLDDLIRAKEAIGRDKDVQAVIQLRAIREKLKRT